MTFPRLGWCHQFSAFVERRKFGQVWTSLKMSVQEADGDPGWCLNKDGFVFLEGTADEGIEGGVGGSTVISVRGNKHRILEHYEILNLEQSPSSGAHSPAETADIFPRCFLQVCGLHRCELPELCVRWSCRFWHGFWRSGTVSWTLSTQTQMMSSAACTLNIS